MKKVVVDATNLVEDSEDFSGFYLINGVRYEHDDVSTGWEMGDKVAKALEYASDTLGEYCASGMGGRKVEFTYDAQTDDLNIKDI